MRVALDDVRDKIEKCSPRLKNVGGSVTIRPE